MEKKEYFRRLEDINKRYLELALEKKELESQYIRESELNNKFGYGEKVLVRKDKETFYAFVVGLEITHDGEIRLELIKAKKDGTPSKNLHMYYFPECGHTVEKIEGEVK